MASLRVIKKDIDYLVSEVVWDSWALIELGKCGESEEALSIIEDALVLREQLFHRVNHPDKSNIKGHYREINNDLESGIDALFERVGGLIQSLGV